MNSSATLPATGFIGIGKMGLPMAGHHFTRAATKSRDAGQMPAPPQSRFIQSSLNRRQP